MITGELKNKIDQLWEMLWTEGNANPLTNIEQLTYLLFMKDLDRVELGRENDAEFLGIPYEGIFPKDNNDKLEELFFEMNQRKMDEERRVREQKLEESMPNALGQNAPMDDGKMPQRMIY